ncbi:hypothetical protein QAD02_012705 [Eretmocerus hayati]|uniref:Uncharacterized protein n=1 Tax=Eretmocerus hayati TaxID=131215 RepID=A0ACC2P1C7_9HYME|nr:hypothetical protein QAD02_012705 [Eretmocerus hayati]
MRNESLDFAMQENPYDLTDSDKDLVSKGEKLKDQHVEKSHQLIQIATSTLPRSILLANKTELICPISRVTRHLRIIHCCTDQCNECLGGHWIYFFYDGGNIFIYDSLNFKSLYENAEDFLRALCPFFDDVSIYFPDAQYQANGKDCGPHAMAMVTSVVFGEDPNTVDYNRKLLRRHILLMNEENVLIPSPNENNGLTRNPSRLCPTPRLAWNTIPRELQKYPLQAIYVEYRAQELNHLSRAIRDYLANSTVPIGGLRRFADEIFEVERQQDFSELMTFSFAKSDNLSSIFKHSLIIMRTCASCGSKTKNKIDNYILNLQLPNNYKNCDLQMIPHHNLSIWTATEIDCGKELSVEEKQSMECDQNGHCLGKIMEKMDLTSKNDSIIVPLNIPRTTHSGELGKINDLHLQHLSEKDVITANSSYTIESVILHRGRNIYQGHYTNILRGINLWVRVNDTKLEQGTLSKSSEANPYIIILKKQKDHFYSSASSPPPPPILSSNTEANTLHQKILGTEKFDSRKVKNVIGSVQLPVKENRKIFRLVETIDLTLTEDSELAEGAFLRTKVPRRSTKSRAIVHESSDLTTVTAENEKLCTGIGKTNLQEKNHEPKTHNHLDLPHSKGDRRGFKVPRICQVSSETAQIVNSKQTVVSRQKRKGKDGYIHISPLEGRPILKSSFCGSAVNEEKPSLNSKSVPTSRIITDIQSSVTNPTVSLMADPVPKAYPAIYGKSTDVLLKYKERYIARLMENLDSPCIAENRIQADQLVTGCIHVKGDRVLKLKRFMKKLSTKCELAVSKLVDVSILDNVEFATSTLCGKPNHHSTTAPYFLETAYDTRKVTNILPSFVKAGKTSSTWTCHDYCRKVDVDILRGVKSSFEEIIGLGYPASENFFGNVDTCTSETHNTEKRGHPITCYVEPLTCASKLLKTDILSCHYASLRTVKRMIYEVKRLYDQIGSIELALAEGDFASLLQIRKESEDVQVQCSNTEGKTCLDEVELTKRYLKDIEVFTRIDQDPPPIPCISCVRLCTSRYVDRVEKHLIENDSGYFGLEGTSLMFDLIEGSERDVDETWWEKL